MILISKYFVCKWSVKAFCTLLVKYDDVVVSRFYFPELWKQQRGTNRCFVTTWCGGSSKNDCIATFFSVIAFSYLQCILIHILTHDSYLCKCSFIPSQIHYLRCLLHQVINSFVLRWSLSCRNGPFLFHWMLQLMLQALIFSWRRNSIIFFSKSSGDQSRRRQSTRGKFPKYSTRWPLDLHNYNWDEKKK